MDELDCDEADDDMDPEDDTVSDALEVIDEGFVWLLRVVSLACEV